MVHHDGTWHLFFQNNPYGTGWGNMHWGHATSVDLMHWTAQPLALKPDAMGSIYSGSGVVDWKNSSGFGSVEQPPLVFFYTAAGNPTTQCLAYSNDGGKTLVKFPGNPVLPEVGAGNRDPKVIWHEPSRRWVMVLYVEKEKKHFIRFYNSPDLKKWTYQSELESFYECPDLFELPIEGHAEKTLWVLTGADSDYFLGTFDGVNFKPVTPKLQGYDSKIFYASQSFSDGPRGRRIRIGWLRAESPGMAFNQCMSLPLELGLRMTADGPRLTTRPADEVFKSEGMPKERVGQSPLTVTPSASGDSGALKVGTRGLKVKLSATAKAADFELRLRGATIAYQAAGGGLTVNGMRAAVPVADGMVGLSIYLDRTTLELFSDDGLTYLAVPFIAKDEDDELGLRVTKGELQVRSLSVSEMK